MTFVCCAKQYEGKRWHIPVRWSGLKCAEICLEHLRMQQDVECPNTLSDEQGARDGESGLEWIKSFATHMD